MNRREVFKGLAAAGLSMPFVRPALAQAYPSRPIRIVVPTPGGAPPDILARIVGNAISEAEGWTVVVENKPGGAMTIGAADVLRQPADGYTLFSVTAPIAAAQALVPSAKLHVETDFVPVIHPGKHTFSSGGFGTPAHLLGELFKLETGVQTLHVPYKGNPQAIADIINGTNTYQFITAVAVVDLIASGKLRALVAMSQNRVPALKDVPTIVEAGYPKLASEDWAGILVKSGTPAPVVERVNVAVNKALKLDKVRDAFAKVGADTAGGTPDAFGKLVRDEVAHWSKVIKDADIKINP